MIKKFLSRLTLLAFATCAFAADPAPPPDSNQARIARIENGLLPRVLIKGTPKPKMTIAERMAHHKVPGISIAVINGGAIEWARGYGVLKTGGKEPVTAETLFQAASISKPVAALGALYLVEQGKLNLDEDVNLKLKSWKVPENEFTKDKKVTLRALLSHSAGTTVHGFRGYAASEPVPSLLEVLDGRKPPANSAPVRVDTVPGTKWRYSGGGFTVAQLLITDVSDRPFPEFMKETVLDRLAMKESTYEQPLSQASVARAAVGHSRTGEAIEGRWRTYPEMAAAGLWTTPSDLARFAIEIQESRAGKSNKVLSQKMMAAMLKPGVGGHGLGIETKGEGRAATFSHGGSNEGFRTMMFAYAETGQGAVIMTNGDSGSLLYDEILRSVAAEYNWPDYRLSEREVVQVAPEVYASYAGSYQTSNAQLTVAVEGGRLFLKASNLGPRPIELFPESEAKYFATMAELTFTFVKDESGKVAEIMIQAPRGEPVKAKKLN